MTGCRFVSAAGLRAVLMTAVVSVFVLTAMGLQAQDRDALLRETAAVRAMSEADVIALVPKQSGLQYVDCPNCTAGRQERQLTWTLDRPDEVYCRFCGHRYPSEKYPDKEAVVVKTPLGNTARFEYWADESGYRHFFKARRDDEVRRYLSSQATALAHLYTVTKDPAHARRAAVILDRFAQVFPDWCYHYDYPFQQKVIYDGDVSPAEFRPGFRTARWNWWAYGDIPMELLRTYELIRESGALAELSKEQGVDVAARIENDLLRKAGEQVISNRDELSNMSPGTWSDLAQLGRTLNEPRYVHEVVRRFRHLITTKFFYDGTWCEGAPSYGSQTVNALQAFARTVRGYSDPPGFVDAVDNTRFDNLNLEEEAPVLSRGRYVLNRLKFPNGRPVPVHDTWSSDRARRSSLAPSSYLLPALGHACLRTGSAEDPIEWHLTWSGGYGHAHADINSLILFSGNRESLSDLGYTHTAYRAWTIATAAHNTVVIDGKSQASGSKQAPTDGSLLTMDMRRPEVQIVRVDGRRAYPELVQKYERTLLVVDAGPGARYAVDVFDVEGGSTHDYFLHGDADTAGSIRTSTPLKERGTLLPEGMTWKPPTDEGQTGRAYRPYDPYGFLQKLKGAAVDPIPPRDVDFMIGERPTVRALLLAESESELIVGENPAIRGADEDDAQLGKFSRPFMMLRHSANGRASRFVTVIDPRRDAPSVMSVQQIAVRPGVLALAIETVSSRQLIVLGASIETEIPGASPIARATFRGEAGVLSTAVTEGGMNFAYGLGDGGWTIGNWRNESPPRQKGTLAAIENDAIVVNGCELAPLANDVVRLVTADGWVYPFTVVATEPVGDALRIKVAETPAMEFGVGKKTFELKSFPGRSHAGDVSVEWVSSRFDDRNEKREAK